MNYKVIRVYGINDGAEGESWQTSLVINRWGQEKFSTIAGTPVRVTHYSIYGEPDPSISRCVRGGGFNPCSGARRNSARSPVRLCE